MKYFKSIPSLLLFLILTLGMIPLTRAATWVDDPNNCPTTFESQNCLFGESLCGYDDGIVYCYDTSLLMPPSSGSTSTTQHTSSFGGGFLLNCEAYSGSSSPYCTNGGATWCNADPSCLSTNRITNCTSGSWETFTCGGCLPGYTSCDGNSSTCEVQNGVTAYPGRANSVYNSDGSCTSDCKSGFSDCDADPSNGCEVQSGTTTCTTADGAPGVYSGCTCVAQSEYFETGVDSQYSTANPLLWGTQFGVGPLLNLERDSAGEFIIDMDASGNVTFQDAVTGPISLSALGGAGGDNLGDHLATQDLDLDTFTLIGDAQGTGTSGTEGLRVDANGNIALGSTSGFFFGDFETDNSWRIIGSAGSLAFEKRESGAYVTKALLEDELTLSQIQASDANGLTFSNTTQDVMFIDDDGEVGIKVMLPDYPLDVNGDINISSGSVYRINGTALGISNLGDTDLTGLSDKNVLQYDLATSTWIVTPSVGILTDQGLRIDSNNQIGLIDTCGDGQILSWDDTASKWICDNTANISTLVPYSGATSDIDLGAQNLTTTGNISAGNLNITNWDSAFAWGDHSTAGYLTNASNVEDMATAGGAGTVPMSDGAGALTMTDVIATSELASESDLETLIGGVNVLTENDTFNIEDLSNVDTTVLTDGNILQYSTATSTWVSVANEKNWGDIENDTAVYMDYRPNDVACANNEVLKYTDDINGDTVADDPGWVCAPDGIGVESDPVFTASPAGGITAQNITDWNSAFSWGDHSTVGYLTNASNVEDMATAGGAGTVPMSDGAGALTMTDVIATSELASESDLETLIGGVNVLTENDTFNIEDLSNVDTTGVADESILKYSTATSSWVIAADEGTLYTAGTGLTLSAGNEFSVTDNAITPTQLNVPDNGTAGQVLTSNADGSFAWADDQDSQDWSQIPNAGGVYMDYRPNDVACANNEVLKYTDDVNGDTVADDPGWICASDIDTDTQLSDGDIATMGYIKNADETDPTVNALGKASLSCAIGEIAKWDDNDTPGDSSDDLWVCAADEGLEYTAGTGLSLSAGNEFSVTDNAITPTQLNVPSNGTVGQILSSNGDGSFTWVSDQDDQNWSEVQNDTDIYMDYRPGNVQCSSGEVLKYTNDANQDGTSGDFGWICENDQTGSTQDGNAQGEIVFWDTTASQYLPASTSDIVWDNTDKRLGLGTSTPKSTLDVQGGMTVKVTGVNDTNYTVVADDYIVAYTAFTAPRTVTLPDSLCTDGRTFIIKDASGNVEGNVLTVDPEGATLLDGKSTYEINRNYNSINVYCHNGNWFIQ